MDEDPDERYAAALIRFRSAGDRLDAATRAWDSFLPSADEPVILRSQPGLEKAYQAVVNARAAHTEAMGQLREALRALTTD